MASNNTHFLTVLLESHTNFKQGLQSRWEDAYTVLYSNFLSVYTDRTKTIELFRFHPGTSRITFNEKSEKGLFVLKDDNGTMLYLFEIGSELMLRTWVNTLQINGWNSAGIDQQYAYQLKPRGPPSNWTYTSVSLNNSLNINRSNLLLPQLLPQQATMTSFMERSYSLPSLIQNETEHLNEKCSNQRKNQMENKSKNGKRCSGMKKLHTEEILVGSLRGGRNSESGYCSKESLLTPESEKQHVTSLKQGNNHLYNDDLSSSNASSVFFDDKMVEVSRGVSLSKQIDESEDNLENIFDARGILEIANETQTAEECKAEKKAPVAQLISNIKSKFGSTASRKKSKKNGKHPLGSFCGRLLWNSNGEWLDKWFVHQDGLLCGCKEQVTAKQPEVMVDVRTCTLTCYSSNDVLRRVNLFQLSTKDHQTHIFVAWNETDYELWVDCLSYTAERKQELYGLKMENLELYTADDDGGDTEIVPYERALGNNEQRKATSSSSDTSTAHARVDSIDSGNDGDESGLESSLSSNNKLIETRKKLDKERKTRSGRSSSINENPRSPTNEKINEVTHDEVDNVHNKPSELRLELTRQVSRDSTSTENDPKSPGVESQTIESESDFKKSKRSSFIHKKWSFFEKSSGKSKKDDESNTPHKKVILTPSAPCDIISPTRKHADLTDHDSVISGSVGSLSRSSRPNSLNISLPESSIDNNLSEHTWEGFNGARFKKAFNGSEDDMSEAYSMPSLIDAHKHEELEDQEREKTLLRKRRNSLTLERGQVVIKLETLNNNNNNNNIKKSTSKQNIQIAAECDSSVRTEKILNLERRLEHIDSQIEIIDKRIDLRIDPSYKQKKSRRGTGQLLTRLKLSTSKSKPLENIHSMSVESLSSSASRESHGSSIGRDSPSAYNANQTFEEAAIKKDKVEHKRSSDGSDVSTASNGLDKSQFTGLEELMITTQKLESTNANFNQPLSTSDKWRSKSLGSVDLIKNRGMKKERKDSAENTTTESALIIEDFEKFSEMLTNQMKTRQKSTPIIIEL